VGAGDCTGTTPIAATMQLGLLVYELALRVWPEKVGIATDAAFWNLFIR